MRSPDKHAWQALRGSRRQRLLVILVGLALSGPALAFDFGHARLRSAQGQPLSADVSVVGLTPQEAADLQVSVAPADAWRQAGLTPPVELSSLRVQLQQGVSSGTRIVRLTSDQPLRASVADLLIDVGTASGQRRHQVSVLAQAQGAVTQSAGVAAPVAGQTRVGAPSRPDGIAVRKGDTLLSIARRHAVPGVSTYQLMAALLQANPQAFIDGNMNLLKSGALLQLPDAASLTALSDAQARQLFARHAQAFGQRRANGSAAVADVAADGQRADRGQVSQAGRSAGQAQAQGPRDQLKLSAPDAAGAAGQQGGAGNVDDAAATRKGMQDSRERVAQLEGNIQALNQELQSQGATAGNDAAGAAQDAGASASANGAGATGQAGAATGAGANAGVGSAAAAAGAGAAQPGGATNAQGQGGADAGQAGVSGAASANAAAASSSAASGAAASASAADAASTTTYSSQGKGPWLTNTMLAIITAVLALLVLIVAWLLRRANAADRDAPGGQITDDMIQEKLHTIDLDLGDRNDSSQRRGQ